jgi:hypothetical protein
LIYAATILFSPLATPLKAIIDATEACSQHAATRCCHAIIAALITPLS